MGRRARPAEEPLQVEVSATRARGASVPRHALAQRPLGRREQGLPRRGRERHARVAAADAAEVAARAAGPPAEGPRRIGVDPPISGPGTEGSTCG